MRCRNPIIFYYYSLESENETERSTTPNNRTIERRKKIIKGRDGNAVITRTRQHHAAAVRTHQALLGSKATDCITDMRTEVHGQDGGVYNHGVS